MVWTNRASGAFVRSDRDEKDQYVVHVCEHFWSVVNELGYRYLGELTRPFKAPDSSTTSRFSRSIGA